uniref:hypothetical protein n=1 Tax=Pseudomonas syringae group genomosp. 7 TaxID=251699 RepID=UPI0037705818
TQRPDTPRAIAQQDHRAISTAIDLHLTQIIEPEIIRSLHPVQQTRHLPARSCKSRAKKRLLLANTVADRQVASSMHNK